MAVDLNRLSEALRARVENLVKSYQQIDSEYDQLVRDGVLLYLGRDEHGQRQVMRAVLLDESASALELERTDEADLAHGLDAGVQDE